MTSTQVMGARAGFLDTLTPVSRTNKSDVSDFKSFLDFSKNQSNLESISQPINTNGNRKETVKEEIKSDKAVETDNVKVNQPTKESRQVESDDVNEVKEAYAKVVEAIEEELDVTEEDIINAIETLGLTPVAILNPENLKDFVVEVKQLDNPIDIVTDEGLLEALNNLEKEVTDIVEDICKALDIEVEDFSQAIEKFQVSDENVETSELPVEESIFDKIQIDVKPEDEIKPENKVVGNKVLIPVENEEPVKKELVRENEEENDLHNFSVHTRAGVQTQAKIVTETREEAKEQLFHEGEQRPSNDIFSFAENLVKETVTALNESIENASFTTVDATKIINQITESIKTQISAETTEINMKLHPESLGNVNVRISTNNEGLLTARFIAENESVKSVIEAQTISLKETLESKGVTVEAIEVMVASHRFDESFNRERGNAENNNANKKGLRRLNLSEEISDEESEDEAESLAKDIMRQNGNSIDYTA